MAMPEPALPRARLQRVRLAVESVVEAIARDVVRRQRGLQRADVRRKGAGDFVTSIDVAAERTLQRRLRRVLPEAGFVGEESAPDAIGAGLSWVVDPIDGTSNYAAGLPQFAVSVALLDRGAPLLGVLWCLPEDCGYTAIAGQGAFRHGRRVAMPAGRRGDAAIYGCQWHRGQQDLEFLAALQRDGGRVRTFGSTVVQLADVVMGRLDANVQQQGRIWDFAAAGLLVLEAGGRFTDWNGRPVFPLRQWPSGHTATIAAGPAVHRRLVQRLAAASSAPPPAS